MIHSPEARNAIATAIANSLRGGWLEILGDEGETPLKAFFAVVEVSDALVRAALKTAPAVSDIHPWAYRCTNAASQEMLSGGAGPGEEIELPEVVKKGAVVTFNFSYEAPN